MKIGITGVTGFIGGQIKRLAIRRGHTIIGYSRSADREISGCGEVREFDPPNPIDASGLDAIIHLAGESVLGYWTEAKKARIRDSRIEGTRAVTEGIRDAENGPSVLVSASAIGFYGDTGQSKVDENSPAGEGFLAEVCEQWETGAKAAESSGTRVSMIRIGFVLGRDGGAIPKIRTAFKFCLGGRFGDGKQWMPLVHVEDIASMFLDAVEKPSFSGPINAVMPDICTNAEFTREVAACLGRPAFLHAPAFALRLIAGEASTLFLMSSRVESNRAVELGFKFQHPGHEKAIAACLT